jgi:hypothetical protein
MKKVLKFILIFVLGLAAGSTATGLLLDKFHRSHKAQLYAMNVGSNAMLAQFLKEGNQEIVLEYTQRNLAEDIKTLYENEELRNASTADFALWASKRFYVCTNTPYPEEIAAFMNDVPLPEAYSCGPPEE